MSPLAWFVLAVALYAVGLGLFFYWLLTRAETLPTDDPAGLSDAELIEMQRIRQEAE
ncbi:hypothetical protein HRJ34_15445 [Rhizorhabdus wittichii]|uniref:Uncharacterized protein n=1 Tax=Rhizorhabdus wittichii TaxID=160791 RepID=A0A975CYM5_9SPHN|nr:hypothetical protein [Rhizorhabdus wittichii]QTH19762.1 hypothetical protein HRJ34_15445 [Rhizorhabdus wittichii]